MTAWDDRRAALVQGMWQKAQLWGAIGPTRSRGRRFGAFGEGSIMWLFGFQRGVMVASKCQLGLPA